jgi:uncharacterized integral membrane protein
MLQWNTKIPAALLLMTLVVTAALLASFAGVFGNFTW